jgi:hypothetical protein
MKKKKSVTAVTFQSNKKLSPPACVMAPLAWALTPGTAARLLARAPTGVFVALLHGRRGMIAVLAVAISQGRSLPGGDGRPRPTRQPADAPGGRHSQGAVVPGVALLVTFCPSGGQNPRRDVLRLSAAPAPSPGRTTVAPSHPAQGLTGSDLRGRFGRHAIGSLWPSREGLSV